MPQVAIIADDLTGATDTSACFADAGLSVVVPLGDAAFPAADVVALTTESRDLLAGDAVRVVDAAVQSLFAGADDQRPRWLYKKIDSALRGHPREEVLAAMEASGLTSALIAPALPAEGRTTAGGQQYVDGVPLEVSHLGGPGADSRLSHLFANDRGLPVEHIDLETIRQGPRAIANVLDQEVANLIIADAETDDDLLALAQALTLAGQPRLLSGAAGFARQLARALPLTPQCPRPMSIATGVKPVLAVVGSQHEATKRQIDHLRAAGVPIVRLTQEAIDDPACSVESLIADITHHLAMDSAAAVTTVGLSPARGQERAVASRLAAVAVAPAVVEQVGGLLLTGGDIAAAVCQTLGARAIWLGGEIYAGQPWGVLDGGALPGLPVATKAGSFGDDRALIACVEFLRQIQG